MRTDLPRWPRIAVAAAAVVGLGVGVAGTAVVVGLAGEDGLAQLDPSEVSPITLVSYDTCDSALAELKAAALPHVGPYGLAGEGPGSLVDRDGAADEGAASAPDARAQSEGGAAAPKAAEEQRAADAPADDPADADQREHSGTNVHESGVDEPDLVKTDGRRVVTVANGVLTAVDVATRERTARVQVPGGAVSQLLLDGDRALVMTSAESSTMIADGPTASEKPVAPVEQGSRLLLVDLSGVGEILGTLEVDGAYLDARQVDSVARVVVRSTPRLKFGYPMRDNDIESAAARNRAVVENSTIADWLPKYTLDNGGTRSEGQLVECAAVSHPHRYTGSALLTVLTVDLRKELTTGDPISIAADGDTVYGTGTSLYVADDHVQHGTTNGFLAEDRPTPVNQRTEVYQFDISGQGSPVHVASGGVEGTLLNQYSLSEHDGHLRIATTVGQSSTSDSRSMVTVLTRRDNELALTGRVDGLGKGERIYSVRYQGDLAYVVTFRETDPLYTVDLSDPAAPRVTGELKITGYSAYLHPVGEDRLLGIGQEATTNGVATGVQVSLFDTSTPAATRVGQFHLPQSYSEVENDPHAFLYWPEKNIVVLPVVGMATGADPTAVPESGMLVLRLSGDRLDQVGVVRHADDRFNGMPPPPRRALVIGEELWTVSDFDIVVSTLDTLTTKTRIAI
ncbi:beta-propeller domain-containing protein [Actinophytocola sediminis]